MKNTNENVVKNINLYPIEAGERALFASKNILEQMARDLNSSGNIYDSVSTEQIFEIVSAIDVFTQIFIKRCEDNNRGNSQDLLSELQKIPLFFSRNHTKIWEIERVWSSKEFCPYTEIVLYYGNVLDSPNPSNAYVTNDNKVSYIWQTWLSKVAPEDLVSILEHSKEKWLAWESRRPQTDSNVFKNVLFLGDKIGLEKPMCLTWFIFELMVKSEKYTSLWNLSLKEFKDYKPLFNAWGKPVVLQDNKIEKLFYDDSILVQSYIYKKISNLNLNEFSINNLIKQLYTNNKIGKLLFLKIADEKILLNNFIQPYQKAKLPLSAWSYLEDEINSIKVAMQNNNQSILLYGDKGNGKSSLISALLDSISKSGWIPQFIDASHSVNENKENDGLEFQLQMALKLVRSKSNVLIFENSLQFTQDVNKKIFLKNFVKNKACNQIWVFDDLEKIDSDLICCFDIALNVSEMPVKYRIQLANNYFQDSDLAFRIAQAVKSPQQLLDTASWCHNTHDYSWKNAFTYLTTMSRVLAKSKNSDGELLQIVEHDDSLADFAGNKEANDLLERLTDYFQHPQIYKDIGAKTPKGILLMGPPGTGKTHFAKHLGKNVDIPLFMVETSKLVTDPTLIVSVFNEANKKSPCILFFDEIDSLINTPEELSGINLQKQKILNTFLAQLDGFGSTEGILVIGATHRKIKADPAAVRAGRLGETIHLTLPDSSARKEIWKAHLKSRKVDSNVDLNQLVHASSGFSGAEIAEAVNKGAIISAAIRQSSISLVNLLKATDNIFWGGADNSIIINEQDKYKTAIHEAGHALIALKNAFKVKRITVRPRAKMLGAVQWETEEGMVSFNKEHLVQRIELALAGILSEKVRFGYYTNGGTSDLKYARSILRHMLLETGFGDSFGLSYSDTLDVSLWSENRKLALENEETEILNTAMTSCIHWLEENLELVENLALVLLKEKEISGNEIYIWQEKIESLNKKNVFMIKNDNGINDITIHHNQ